MAVSLLTTAAPRSRPTLSPPAATEADYVRMADAIRYIVEHYQEQPSLGDVAAAAGMSPFHFQRTFARWAGVSPKRFLQYVTLGRAKELLDGRASILDAALEVGLSGPSRLHDLFVACEAMTPGEFKAIGGGLVVRYGLHDTPLGRMLLGATERGICWLAFAEDDPGPVLEAFATEFAGATLVRDEAATAGLAARAASLDRSAAPLPLHLKGTNFQIKIWEALLRIPFGELASYHGIAKAIGQPKAVRAVGSANGDNHVAVLIPCHRVIRSDGSLGGYAGGLDRKKKLLEAEGAKAEQRRLDL